MENRRFSDQIILNLDKKVDSLGKGLSDVQVSLAVVCSALEDYKDVPQRQVECSRFISSIRRFAFWTACTVGTAALSACGYVATHSAEIAQKVTKLNQLLGD